MKHRTHPDYADLLARLGPQVCHHLLDSLHLILPPPLTDSPQARVRRDHAAIARIAELCPANAIEAELAVHYVVTSETGQHCLHLARRLAPADPHVTQHLTQALAMTRLAQSTLRLLLRMQRVRRKSEADSAARKPAAATRQRATEPITPAPSSPPPAPTQPWPDEAQPPARRWLH